MAVTVGEKAPDFTLPTKTANGPELWQLSDNVKAHNVLLLFVPMAFTSVCTQEFCDITNSMDDYTSLDAKVVGISGDNPFAQEAWAQKEGIGFPLLSDYEHEVAKAYGVAYASFLPDKNLTMGGVPKRSAFLLDREGVVQYAEVNDSPGDLPNFEAIKAKLKELS